MKALLLGVKRRGVEVAGMWITGLVIVGSLAPALMSGLWGVAIGALGAIASIAAARGTAPLVSVVLPAVCSACSPVAWPALGLALARVSRSGRTVLTAVSLGAASLSTTYCVYAVIPSGPGFATDASQIAFGVVGTGAMFAATAAGTVLVQQRREAVRVELERFRAADTAAREVDRARETERRLLASELHDLVGHRLAVLNLLIHGLSQAEGEERDSVTAQATSQVRLAQLDLILLLSMFHDPDQDELSAGIPAEDLEDLFSSARDAGLDLVVDFRIDTKSLPSAHARTLDRFFREGLTNVVKYAGPGRVTASAGVSDGVVSATLVSPLRRETRISGSRRGLNGLQQRAELLGGSFTKEVVRRGRSGSSFKISIRIPHPVDQEPGATGR